jgi:hypothetical protein
MANRPVPALVLREGDPERLTRTVRSSSAAAGLAQRSRIVLLAAEGVANETIAERVGVAPNHGAGVAAALCGAGAGSTPGRFGTITGRFPCGGSHPAERPQLPRRERSTLPLCGHR